MPDWGAAVPGEKDIGQLLGAGSMLDRKSDGKSPRRIRQTEAA
jgi:hypothetical protein